MQGGRDLARSIEDGSGACFVRLETAQGPREVWGKDIERAVNRSLSQPKIGEQVVLEQWADSRHRAPHWAMRWGA